MEKEVAWLLEEKYNGQKNDEFFADCKRLALGEPLGYLIGYVPFLNCKIFLDSRPLIPRPETELWTEEAIKIIAQYKATKNSLGLVAEEPLRIMDMCAGSGCVGVAVAKQVNNCTVDFAELEKKHLETIQKNIDINSITSDRITILQSNIFSAYPDKKYHFILANPPYIDSTLHRVDDSVVDFEPHTALFGGHGGLEVILQLITEAKYHLEHDGQLWIEHEPEQSKEIEIIAAAHGFSATVHKDQFDTERYSILVLQ